jgi:hypothetical protein
VFSDLPWVGLRNSSCLKVDLFLWIRIAVSIHPHITRFLYPNRDNSWCAR